MTKIKNQAEIAIIGGGIIGMLTAYMLRKAGAEVILVEKSEYAGESSWAGGGILSPIYPWRYPDAANALAFKSRKLYPGLADEIMSISGIDPEYQPCGMHILSSDIPPSATQWLDRHNVAHRQAHPGENVSQSYGFTYLPEIAQIRNPRLIKSLRRALELNGVVTLFNQSVSDINALTTSGFELHTENSKVKAKKVVVCAGAWTSKLLSDYLPSLDIRPVRGQMLLFKAPVGFLSSIILAKGKYIIPRLDGRVLVGSTMEDVGFDKATTANGKSEILAFIDEVCPELASFPLEKHWSGLRPGSPDGVPVISEHPEISGLYVNSGHFRNGVVMAPASAKLMRDIILQNNSDLDTRPYQIGEPQFVS